MEEEGLCFETVAEVGLGVLLAMGVWNGIRALLKLTSGLVKDEGRER